MIWNQNRLAYLSGLNESKESLETPALDSEESIFENKIRMIIREEIQKYIENRSEKTIDMCLKNFSLGPTLGFAGTGFRKRNAKNKSAARVGRIQTFGGPGFM